MCFNSDSNKLVFGNLIERKLLRCASVRVRIRTSVIRGPENASASLDGMATLVPGLVRSIPTARAAKVIATAGITRSVPP